MSNVGVVALRGIGLSCEKANETIKNKDLTSKILQLISLCEDYEIWNNTDDRKPFGKLLYVIATKLKSQIYHRHSFLIDYILNGSIVTESQLNAAFDYFLDYPTEAIQLEAFHSACGIGVVVTLEQIKDQVERALTEHREALLSQRYHFSTGILLGAVLKQLKWANAKIVKEELDRQLFNVLGAKTLKDEQPLTRTKKQMNKKGQIDTISQQSTTTTTTTTTIAGPTTTEAIDGLQSVAINDGSIHAVNSFAQFVGEAINFHKVGENYKTDGYVITKETMKLLKQHVLAVDGRCVTRFPPEPNGILHIGHAKAINFNFGYAQMNNGSCYLRYDDTNPEKEEERYFVAIREMVEWLGYEPYRVTYASDYFHQLHSFAVELIQRQQAYVCHQSYEEIQGFNATASPWRCRPIEESLQLFADMKDGKIAEGGAILRMKVTLKDGKVDPVAYRIKFMPHHRTGNEWCIYPTYDYTHCLCDSIENITHSLCTKEFQDRRSSYYWLCNALDIYCPVQWEYGRLNLLYTVVSKRKILRLVEAGIVNDWDDPRLYTLTALRRRGVPPEAINLFCARVGVTMSQTALHPNMLDACTRTVLNDSARRSMVVLEPLTVIIDNWKELTQPTGALEGRCPLLRQAQCEVADYPSGEEKGDRTSQRHVVALSATVYIEASDFFDGRTEQADKGYKRWTHDQPVGLKHCSLLLVFRHVEQVNGQQCVHAIAEVINIEKRPKAFVHWVCEPVVVEVRLFTELFTAEDPENHPGGFIAAVNKDSCRTLTHCFADRYITESARSTELERFQFERLGYFVVDRDSTAEKLVFNRITTLVSKTVAVEVMQQCVPASTDAERSTDCSEVPLKKGDGAAACCWDVLSTAEGQLSTSRCTCRNRGHLSKVLALCRSSFQLLRLASLVQHDPGVGIQRVGVQ